MLLNLKQAYVKSISSIWIADSKFNLIPNDYCKPQIVILKLLPLILDSI